MSLVILVALVVVSTRGSTDEPEVEVVAGSESLGGRDGELPNTNTGRIGPRVVVERLHHKLEASPAPAVPPMGPSEWSIDGGVARSFDPSRSPLEQTDGGPLDFSDLARVFEQETHDPDWSSNLETYLYAALEADELTLDLLRDVDCRQTLCRLELNAGETNMTALFGLQTTVQSDAIGFASRFMSKDAGGGLVAYVARDGFRQAVNDFKRESQAESPQ